MTTREHRMARLNAKTKEALIEMMIGLEDRFGATRRKWSEAQREANGLRQAMARECDGLEGLAARLVSTARAFRLAVPDGPRVVGDGGIYLGEGNDG